jgi:hypothetical protein
MELTSEKEKTTAVFSRVGVYQQAVRKLLAARGRVVAWVQLVGKAAMVLDGDKWRAVAPTDGAARVQGLRTVLDGGFDLTAMPSGKDLLAALEEWRQAWDVVNKTWQMVPAESQVGLKEPKELY